MKKEEKIIKVIEGRERGGSQGKQDGGRALGEKKKEIGHGINRKTQRIVSIT